MKTPYLELPQHGFGGICRPMKSNESWYRHSLGTVIGNQYEVHELLQGGVAEVYLCYDNQRREPVVLKTFPSALSSRTSLYSEMKGEMEKWISLDPHPHIVQCYGMDLADNVPYIVLEWVTGEVGKGTDLRAWLQSGPLDLREALQFSLDVCHGLKYVTERLPGFLHRDLKPENILITGLRVAKITDFGIARFAHETDISSRTLTDLDIQEMNRKAKELSKRGVYGAAGDLETVGIVVVPIEAIGLDQQSGTPGYRSPEQRKGDKLDIRSEVYAIGCVLFEMLTGRTPFESTGTEDLLDDQVRRLVSQSRAIPYAVGLVLTRCLAAREQDRFANLDELLRALSECYSGQFSEAPRLVPLHQRLGAYDYASRGVAFVHLGQLDKALEDGRHAAELEPWNPSYYSICGVVYHRLQRYGEALAEFARAIELDPSKAFLYLNRGYTYYEMGCVEEATRDYHRALKLEPNLIETFVNLGRAKVESGRVEDGLMDLDQAIQMRPGWAVAYEVRAAMLYKLGRYDDALTDYQRAIDLAPFSANAFVGRAAVRERRGDVSGALEDCYHAIDVDPGYALAYQNAGLLLLFLGRTKAARPYFEQAARLGRNEVEVRSKTAECFAVLAQERRKEGDIEGAIADYTKAMQLNAMDASLHFDCATLKLGLGQFEEALNDFTEGLRLEPSNALAHNERAIIYRKLGRFQEALADLEAAMRFDANNAGSYVGRGNVYKELGKLDKALQDYRRALELDPSFATAYLNIGSICANAGDLTTAISNFEQAAQLGDVQATAYARQVRRTLRLDTPLYPHYAAEVIWEAFTAASSPEEMERAIETCPGILSDAFLTSATTALVGHGDAGLRAALEVRLEYVRDLKRRRQQKVS